MAVPLSNTGNSPNANHLLRNVLERVEDSVSFEPMTNAVVLNCGHSLNENTVLELRKDLPKCLCPECRTPITGYFPCFALRNIAGNVSTAPAAPLPENPVKARPIISINSEQEKEAEEHYKTGKALCEQGKDKEGVLLLFRALELNPNYEKAQAYLEFVTSSKHQRRSSLTFLPEVPKASAPPLEKDEKVQIQGLYPVISTSTAAAISSDVVVEESLPSSISSNARQSNAVDPIRATHDLSLVGCGGDSSAQKGQAPPSAITNPNNGPKLNTQRIGTLLLLPGGILLRHYHQGKVEVCNLSDINSMRTFKRTFSSVSQLDNGTIIGGFSNYTGFVVMDACKGTRLKTIRGHGHPVTSLIALPGGMLASSDEKGVIYLQDLSKEEFLETNHGSTSPVRKFLAFPNIALVGLTADNTINFWDVFKGPIGKFIWGNSWTHRILELHGAIDTADIAKVGDNLLGVVNGSRDIDIWNVSKSEHLKTICHNYPVKHIASLSHRRFVTAGDDGVTIWDLITGTPIKTVPKAKEVCCFVQIDDKVLFAGDRSGHITKIDL